MINVNMRRGYVSATVAAQALGVTRQRLHQLLKAGRVNGAFLMDTGGGKERWVVPRQSVEEAAAWRARPRIWGGN